MTVYQGGHVKHNPETGEVAVRTIFPEDQGPQMAGMAWLVSSEASIARNVPTSEVDSWDDLFIPDPSAP